MKTEDDPSVVEGNLMDRNNKKKKRKTPHEGGMGIDILLRRLNAGVSPDQRAVLLGGGLPRNVVTVVREDEQEGLMGVAEYHMNQEDD